MIFSDHEVFTLENVELSMDHISEYKHAGMCSIHHKKTLNLFCDGPECQTPMCHICCITSHMSTDSNKRMPTDSQKHIPRDIKKVYTEKVQRLMVKKTKYSKRRENWLNFQKESKNNQIGLQKMQILQRQTFKTNSKKQLKSWRVEEIS